MASDVINPCGIFERGDKALAPRKPLSKITTIGLFSNLKANADLFLEEVSKHLKRRNTNLEFVVFQKIASQPADFDQQWLDRVHAVAAAFGD